MTSQKRIAAGMISGVTVKAVGFGIGSERMNGQNMTPEKKTYELKKLYRTLACHDRDCDQEHNDDGSSYSTGHHYGCLCQRCALFYYLRLK
jgi:hypothetical protein